jgi:hypothetical protein
VSLKVVQFFAVVLTAVALVPGAAHVLSLPNKIGLAQEPYFITQNIYRGWALLGIVLVAALITNIVLAWMQRGQGAAFVLALTAAFCLAATLVIFFIWTFPANQATSNWTAVPADWEVLRLRWEYSHAVNAAVTFVALCAVTLSVLTSPK